MREREASGIARRPAHDAPASYSRLFMLLVVLLMTFPIRLCAAVRLDVFAGYDGILTQGGFFPVIFDVYNDGPPFNGIIELTPGQFGQGQLRQIPVELPTGTLKRIGVPVFAAQQYGLLNWNVRLLDEKRKVRLETTTRQIRKNTPFAIPLIGPITRSQPILPDVKAGNTDLKPLAARLPPELFP